MKPLLCACLLLTLPALVSAGEKVTFEKQGGEITVQIGGEDFATYQTSKEYPKPFFLPVRGPGGTVLTRPLENEGSKDHPHHKGLWVAVDEVNGVKFWAEKGRIENVSVKTKSGSPGVLEVTNHWLGADGNPAVAEHTTITIHPNRLLAYDISFRAVGQPAHFEDTKEGLLAFRMVDSMREKEGGTVVNSEGEKGANTSWGKPYPWIDYYGPVDGKTYGVALFDHPDNLRPSRYHVRNYGLFSISPFGEKAYTKGKQPAKPVEVKPGEPLRLRYGVYVHAGDTRQADVAGVYRKWVESAK